MRAVIATLCLAAAFWGAAARAAEEDHLEAAISAPDVGSLGTSLGPAICPVR